MTVSVVTGAGRGLGKLIAQRLARHHTVLCTDIDGAAADRTAREVGGWSLQQDVRDPASHAFVAEAAKARGPVAVWVNNAGVIGVGALWEHDEATVRRIIDVNFYGVVWGSRAAIGAMRDAGGVLINVSSISALVPTPGLAIYGATKHAVLGLGASLQGDLDREGVPIRVATICPDAMETDMVKEVSHHEDSSILHSAGTMLRAEDVADEIARLAERPRLVTVMPKARAALVHAFRAFPGLELKVMAQLSKLGRRARAKKGYDSR